MYSVASIVDAGIFAYNELAISHIDSGGRIIFDNVVIYYYPRDIFNWLRNLK